MNKPYFPAFLVLVFFSIIAYLVASYYTVDNGSIDIENANGNVAEILIEGQIASSSSDSFISNEAVTSTEIIKFIDRAEKDLSIKAILFTINSGGGAPVPSIEISERIKKVKKPTYSYIKDIGASGAYWIASSTDTIIANKASLVGSIGVTASQLEYAGLMDKYGVGYQRLVAGKYKDTLSPFRNMTTEEELLVQGMLDELYVMFIDEVSENRNLSKEAVTELATGWVYLGQDALNLGLIDDLGTREDALERIGKDLNMTVSPATYKTKRSLLDSLSSLTSGQSFTVGRGIGYELKKQQVSQPMIKS